uniref:ATP synthase F0 subunit 8 n=1 Tax=Narcine timlei TaxID=195316 RepID=UPI0022007D3E|nr:ATP synthase F0 subunit 8 [Narcine timlei]UXL87069.1 ATP synthase F0 subunit 8 [Narcine timlei]
MPQLNPNPWFLLFLFSWLFFLTAMTKKVMTFTFIKEPMTKNVKTIKTKPWDWPWT